VINSFLMNKLTKLMLNRALLSRVLLIALLGLLLPLSASRAQSVTPAPDTSTIHVVQRGENLYQIALHYGSTVDIIARANGLADPSQIAVGQRLLIPNAAPAVAGSAPGVPTHYVIGPADSLRDLAWRFGTTISAIGYANRIVNPAQIYIGQTVALQAGENGRTQTPMGYMYIVQTGDTLYGVALRTGLSLSALCIANGLTANGALFVGQSLLIPASKEGPALVDLPLPFAQFTLNPTVIEQGRTVAMEITMSTPTQLSGSFMNKALVDHSDDGGLTHHLLIGIDAFSKPGIYVLHVLATDAKKQQTELVRNVAITDGGYNSEKIQLPADQKDLLDPRVTQPELDQVMAIVSPNTVKRYFGGPFGLPVPAAITSKFGTRRSYDNGPYDQFHTGNDFGAAPGAPIYAPVGGIVVFTGLLHVRGNATIIDHGWGVYTGYWHQTQILVNVGDVIQPGQIIGKVGSTGRVTGPHLHWELFVNGVQVDSMQWTRLSFP